MAGLIPANSKNLMKISRLLSVGLLTFLVGCGNLTPNTKNYIYYLHGRIIEIQGKEAISEQYGKYDFDGIVKAFSGNENIVIAEVRTENVDYSKYAKKVSNEIDSLINLGIPPTNITVIGASKGAIIASHISDINTNPINYVLLAGNNRYQEENNDWKFHGQVLCFYDLSDSIAGGNYDYWKNKQNHTNAFEQIELKTQLGHGFLYQPLEEWVKPTQKWILTQKL